MSHYNSYSTSNSNNNSNNNANLTNLFNLNNLTSLLQQPALTTPTSNNSWNSRNNNNSNGNNTRNVVIGNKNEPRPLMEIETPVKPLLSSTSSSSSNYNNKTNAPTQNVTATLNTPGSNLNPLMAQVLNQLAPNNLLTALATSLVNNVANNNNSNPSNSNNNNNNNIDKRDDRSSRSISRRSRSPVNNHHNHNRRNDSYDSNRNNNKKRTLSKSPDRHNSSSSSTYKRSSNYQSNSSNLNLNNNNNNNNNLKPSTTNNNNSNTTSSSNSNTNSTSNNNHSNSSSSSNYSKYSIKLPKYQINCDSHNVSSIKHRYIDLYIPSDYSNSKSSYLSSLPLNRPIQFNKRCLFHIMPKLARSINKKTNSNLFDPPDADHKWTVKVMLLAMPSVDELVKRCCNLAEYSQSTSSLEHPSKVIQFLVGSKTGSSKQHDLMALGGAWSKSLDGSDPANNNQTLINTAIRTVKSLTGLDLSPCTQWYRFLDIQYNRNEEYKTIEKEEDIVGGEDGKSQTDKVKQSYVDLNDDNYIENTVIFVPNVWSLMPNSIEYQKIVDAYNKLIECDDVDEEEEEETANHKIQNGVSNLNNLGEKMEDQRDENEKEETKSKEGDLNATNNNADTSDTSNITINSLMQQSTDNLSNSQLGEPTHYSKIDLKKIKVDELRAELAARNLDSKGLKAQLLNRLKEAMDQEKENEEKNNNENNNNDQDMIELQINAESQSDMKIDELLNTPQQAQHNGPNGQIDESAKNITSNNIKPEAEKPKISKQDREKLYKLPPSSHLIIHPCNKNAKYPKFDCQLVSLSHLLDYRKEDNKESIFELSLFAELFNEMLMRDFAFIIYKHFLTLKDKALGNQTAVPPQPPTTASDDTKPKLKTLYRELLLAFTFFDSSRTNYLHLKDLEDLMTSILGLNLTRSKTKFLIENKLHINKDNLFNYRYMTDSYQNKYVSAFKLNYDDYNNHVVSFDSYIKRNSNRNRNDKEEEKAMIEINGITYDFVNTIKKLEKSEQDLTEMDKDLKDVKSELDRVKIQNKSMDRQRQKLNDEINDLKRKLREQERMNRDTYDKYSRYKDCVLKSKNQLGKFLDDMNDCIKRCSTTTTASKDKDESLNKSKQSENKTEELGGTGEAKIANNESSLNDNNNNDEQAQQKIKVETESEKPNRAENNENSQQQEILNKE